MSSEAPETTQGNRRRRRGRNRGRGRAPRGRNRNRQPKKKQNPLIAFLRKLFGLDKNTGRKNRDGSERTKDRDNDRSGRRRNRRDRDRKPRIEEGPTAEEMATEAAANEQAQTQNQPEVNTPKLYIGNLAWEVTESDLFDLFSKVGQVQNAEIVRDRNMNSKGFGFVEMSSIELAQKACEEYHRTDFGGRQIIVGGAKK